MSDEDDEWDKQIEADAKEGKLDFMEAEALKAHAEGRTMRLTCGDVAETKFTPGPWRICTTGNMSNVVEGVAGKTDDYDDGFRAVALVQSCSAERDHTKRDVNRDANMALIAAAPDLYEALKTINELLVYSVAILDAQGPDGVSDEDAMHLLLEQDRSPFREAHTKMNAALAKARGET